MNNMVCAPCEALVVPVREKRVRMCGRTPTTKVGTRHLCRWHAKTKRDKVQTAAERGR